MNNIVTFPLGGGSHVEKRKIRKKKHKSRRFFFSLGIRSLCPFMKFLFNFLSKFQSAHQNQDHLNMTLLNQSRGAGHVCLNQKFSAKFPIGLHVILKLQIKKKSTLDWIRYTKLFSSENPLRCSLAPVSK